MKKNENNKHMCAPDSKVKDQCSYKVWMEQQEDWREVEWKEKQLYNPCMLSQLLCSDASPAQSTVRNLPQILAYSRHLNVPDLLRLFRCFIFESIVQREPPDPSGSILVLCVCVPKLRSCCAATMSDSFGVFFVLFFPFSWLWVGNSARLKDLCPGSASNFIWLLPVLASGSHLDRSALPLFTHVQDRRRLFSAVTALPLMLLASNLPVLSISRPTCWGSVSHWLSEEERHCFWNPATGHGTMGQEQNQ